MFESSLIETNTTKIVQLWSWERRDNQIFLLCDN